MAKRECEVVVRKVPNVSLRWEMWADPVVKGGVGAIEGVRVVGQSSTGWVPLEFDPRYSPSDLIAEIKALADGKEPQPEPSLAEAARVLGRRAGQENDIVSTAGAFLCAAEETSHAGEGCPRVLFWVVDVILRRLANGKW